MSNSFPIYKGDNSGAFGNNFITINLENPLGYTNSKAIFVCGCVQKSFVNPVFPIVVNFSSEETANFRTANTCYLVVFDELGRQRTCKGTLTFKAQNGVLINGGRTCC